LTYTDFNESFVSINSYIVYSPIFPILDASNYFVDFNKIDFVKVKTFLLYYNRRDIISALNTNEASLALSDAISYCISNFVNW